LQAFLTNKQAVLNVPIIAGSVHIHAYLPTPEDRMMEAEQVRELLLQSLEHERGSVDVYQIAIKCARRDDLKDEWERRIFDTRERELLLTEVCRKLGINPEHMTCGREVSKHLGAALSSAMELAHESGQLKTAQLIAAECVTLAETTTHSNWQLLAQCARHSAEDEKDVLAAAVGAVEDEVHKHYYRAHGWQRELHLQALGIQAILPPPEEREEVMTPLSAAHVEQGRQSDSLGSQRSS